MAMPPRSVKRRGAGQRWLVVPLVLTMLVVLADASMHARSDKAQVRLTSAAWVGKVLPEIGASSTQGREIADVATAPLHEGSRPVARELASIARDASATYEAVARADPPAKLGPAAGLLDACLSTRAKAASEMSAAVQALLKGGKRSEASATSQMARAVTDFTVSDNAYQLFTQAMPGQGFTMPVSVWDLGAAHYGAKGYQDFATRILSGQTHLPPHQLTLDAVSTNPVPLSVQGSVQVLPPSSAVSVTAVVSDTGSSPERGVTVTATISPAQGASSQVRSTTVDLAPGRSVSVVLSGFVMAASTPTDLKVTAAEPAGETGSATRSLSVEMAGPNFGATTTSSGPTSTVGTSTTTPSGTTTVVTTSTTVPATTTRVLATTTTALATTTTALATTTRVLATTTTVPATTSST